MTNQLTDRYPERIWVSDEALLFHPPGPGEIDADLNRWDIAAPAYDQLQGKIGDPFRRSVLDPAILSAIGSLKEKKILDAGCGNGYLTNLFAAAGADTLGIDGSVVMIARARQNFPDRSYQVADLNQQLPLDDQSFDAIVCSMVLHTLPKPIITLTELARILKPTGRLIITLPHPCFAYPTGIVHWRLWDRLKHHPAHLEITNYLPERSVSIPLHGIRFPTNRYHRPLTRWWQEFAAAGLVVTSLTEPSYHSVKPRSFFSLPSLKNTPLALVLTLQKLHQKS